MFEVLGYKFYVFGRPRDAYMIWGHLGIRNCKGFEDSRVPGFKCLFDVAEDIQITEVRLLT